MVKIVSPTISRGFAQRRTRRRAARQLFCQNAYRRTSLKIPWCPIWRVRCCTTSTSTHQLNWPRLRELIATQPNSGIPSCPNLSLNVAGTAWGSVWRLCISTWSGQIEPLLRDQQVYRKNWSSICSHCKRSRQSNFNIFQSISLKLVAGPLQGKQDVRQLALCRNLVLARLM